VDTDDNSVFCLCVDTDNNSVFCLCVDTDYNPVNSNIPKCGCW
jgi:hypothetical protein